MLHIRSVNDGAFWVLSVGGDGYWCNTKRVYHPRNALSVIAVEFNMGWVGYDHIWAPGQHPLLQFACVPRCVLTAEEETRCWLPTRALLADLLGA